MKHDKADIIRAVCEAIERGDDAAATQEAGAYPFRPQQAAKRRYTIEDAIEVFLRDGFIDRYSGQRLVNPGVIRVLSEQYPELFPFHKNWKQSETHPAYWELVPTIDHVLPVARGGVDADRNWVTTSMVRNSAKSNWTLDELGWRLLPPGSRQEWDGLTAWLIGYIEATPGAQFSAYVLAWYRASRKAMKAGGE